MKIAASEIDPTCPNLIVTGAGVGVALLAALAVCEVGLTVGAAAPHAAAARMRTRPTTSFFIPASPPRDARASYVRLLHDLARAAEQRTDPHDARRQPHPTAGAPRRDARAGPRSGPVERHGLERDFANLRAAMREAGADEAFIPAAAPGTIELQRTNAYYPSEETYLFAIADAMRTEYQAIVEAGFILQLDDPRVVVQWDLQDPAPTVAEYRAFAELRIAALNRAIAGLPEDRMRYHLCWGSWHGPHTTDIPLADIVDLVLRVGVGGYSIESANARHAHEWTVWERARLPAGKVLIPGVISHNTNAVEHPDLIAQRIVTFARLVGRENVIAGADCGFAQGAAYRRVHPSIMWAKLRALADGARLASARLWR